MNAKLSAAAGIVILFPAAAFAVLKVLHEPYKPSDFMVAGTIATLVCIVFLFVLQVAVGGGSSAFFRRRPKR